MTKNLFDLQRLEKQSKVFTFPAPAPSPDVIVTCHYPTTQELAAALFAAKADLGKAQRLAKQGEEDQESSATTLEALEMTARMEAALQELACYCIDVCSALTIVKVKDSTGTRRISKDNEEALAPVLSAIGKELYKGSEVSKEEKEV